MRTSRRDRKNSAGREPSRHAVRAFLADGGALSTQLFALGHLFGHLLPAVDPGFVAEEGAEARCLGTLRRRLHTGRFVCTRHSKAGHGAAAAALGTAALSAR